MPTFDRIVEAGKSFACSLYRTQPGALIPNPINDVLRVVWDNLCGDDPNGLPPPPTTPFSGGQCVGVAYNVNASVFFTPRGLWDPIQSQRYWGPISGIRIQFQPGVGDVVYVRCRGNINIEPTSSDVEEVMYNSGIGSESVYSQARIDSVSRVDGGPDNCGNPPASYPSASPPPPQGYTSPPTTIVFNDGDDFTAIFNLKPPTSDSPPPPDICLSVIISGVEVRLCFPFGLPPSFGDGDGGDIGDILNNIQNDINNLQNDVDNLQNDFDKFTDPPPPESDPDLNETDSPDDDGGEEDDLPGLKWVVVQLTTLPVKAQFGTPSVNFAGWITFKIGGDYTDRIPIAFENGVFQAPPGATGYAITFTNQAKGISRAYTRGITP